jgi:hypothetical protein
MCGVGRASFHPGAWCCIQLEESEATIPPSFLPESFPFMALALSRTQVWVHWGLGSIIIIIVTQQLLSNYYGLSCSKLFYRFFWGAVLVFELRASHLLGRCSTA